MNVKKRKTWLCVFLVFVLSLFVGCKDDEEKIDTSGLALSRTTVNIDVGDTYELLANLDGVAWSSSNESVATVDEKGRVLGLSAGTAEIYAAAGSTRVKCDVSVKGVEIISTYSVQFASQNELMKVGETLALTATAYKDGALSTETPAFASDNETVATVAANGAVTANAAGVATITASYGTATASCKVYVSDGGLQLLLNETYVNVEVGGQTQLTAKLLKDGVEIAGETAWSAENGNIVIEQNGTLTGAFCGETVVTAQSSGVVAHCRVRVYQTKTVASVDEFLAIADDAYTDYELSSDLDFSDYEWTAKTLVPKLSSKLNGNGHKIFNLGRTLASDRVGIFGELAATASLKNLAVYIDSFFYTDASGALAVVNRGVVENCYVKLKTTAGNTSTAVMLRSGVLWENYGTVKNVMVDVESKANGNRTALFHAFAAKNFGTISDCIVLSSATRTREVTNADETKTKYVTYQLLSGGSDIASLDGVGYKKTSTADNAFDTRRSNCVIFETAENMLTLGAGGYGIDGCAGAVVKEEVDTVKITERTIFESFDGAVWSFGADTVTFHGITLYAA